MEEKDVLVNKIFADFNDSVTAMGNLDLEKMKKADRMMEDNLRKLYAIDEGLFGEICAELHVGVDV
jgi:hypothetical protein